MSNKNPGCLGIVLKFLGIIPKESYNEPLPYGLRDDFLSKSELSFYKVLQQALGNRAIVFAKISLSDIFFVKRPDKNTAYYNKIARKHVDFLLCLPNTVKPVAGIELDDASHQREDRIKRDRFIEEVFETANLPLIRFSNKSSYSISEINEKVEFLFKSVNETNKSAQEIDGTSVTTNIKPLCPKCGIPMVKRVVNKGEYKGKKFYGCSNFPKCREIIEINKL